MKTSKLIFLFALAGCASNEVQRRESSHTERLEEVSAVSFSDFVKSADVSAEKKQISPHVTANRLNGEGFTISKAELTGTNDSAYYFDDRRCVTKASLAAQLDELGYAEDKSRLPSSERSFESYAVYSKPKSQVNVDFSLKKREQCILALFIKYN